MRPSAPLRASRVIAFGVTALMTTAAIAAPSEATRLEDELSAAETGRRQHAARDLVTLDARAAEPLVRRALGDPDVDVRIAGAQAVAALGLQALAPLLLDSATHPDARLREATVVALGALRPADDGAARAIEPALVRALADPEVSVRGAALRALAERPAPPSGRAAVAEAIATVLSDEQPELRRAAAEALEHVRDATALRALAAHVDDPSPEVRTAIARALGALGDARAAPAVLRIADDTNEEARAAAIAALGALAAPAAVSRLVPLMARPRDMLAGLAAVALGRIAGGGSATDDATHTALRARAGQALIAAVRRDENRAAALEGLRAAGPAAADLLTPLLPPLGVRPSDALLSLASDLIAAGDDRLTARLLEAARIATDARFDVPLTAARPPAGPTRDALVVWLASRLSDPGAAARRSAADALGALGDRRAGRALEAVVSDPDPSTRRAALGALARTSIAAESKLLEAARGSDTILARTAIGALARRHDDAARQALVAALLSGEATIRDAAALGLADDAGASSVVAPLLAALKAGRREVRDAAALALSGPLRGRPDPIAREVALALAATDEPGAAGALELFGVMRDRDAATRLLQLLPRLGRWPIRRARFHAVLGDLLLGGPSAAPGPLVQALLGGLEDPEPMVRTQAAWALGKQAAGSVHAGDAAANALSAHLGDPSAPVRVNALAALARLGLPPSPETLARLARDRELGVRVNAARLGAVVAPIATEPTGWLARASQARGTPTRAGADYALLRIVDEVPGAPRPSGARLGLPDGLVEIAVIDERGIVREEGVPAGELAIDVDPALLR